MASALLQYLSRIRGLSLILLLAGALQACGGGSPGAGAGDALSAVAEPERALAAGESGLVRPEVVRDTDDVVRAEAPRTSLAAQSPQAVAAPLSAAAFIGGLADPGLMMLLVPDDVPASDARVAAWIDAAAEIGSRIAPVTDGQFLAMGVTQALGYAALVLPDQLHPVATDALVDAVRAYTSAGGRTLLTYDFGALTLNGVGQPVYPIPKSRLSDLAGVDYVLYDSLMDRTVGLGPVTALRSTMRELLVPPGKSLPYTAPLAPMAAPTSGLAGAAGLSAAEALFLAPSVSDPGANTAFDPQQFQMLPQYSRSDEARDASGKPKPRKLKINFGRAKKLPVPAGVSKVRLVAAPESATLSQAAPDAMAPQAALIPTSTDPLEALHGYLLGNLTYPTFVTTGDYTGAALAASPQFGLVAGLQQFGKGQVLFVNLPLTYLKGRTDALPMHGYLRYFLHHVLQRARLSAMPNAVAGMTYDWHLDSMAAQAPTLALETSGVFATYSFSIEMTAGPDTIQIDDGLGWDLNNNPVAQQLLQRLAAAGHSIGSHGGWIHEVYGFGATEDNRDTFLPYLELNKAAVDAAVGRPARGYSAPQGNNPVWAMQWLEQQGVTAAYFGGHTGLGATRQYRDGVLQTPALWVFPVTPQGLYATFEEFQLFNVPKAEVIAWYRAMVDFCIAQNTSRLVYAHPPGVLPWKDVFDDLMRYSKNKGAKFTWYPMSRLSDFMARRAQVAWTETVQANGVTRFIASHPSSLAEMVWMVPKQRYLKPTLPAGGATVVDGGSFWLVKAKAVSQLEFRAKPNLTFSS